MPTTPDTVPFARTGRCLPRIGLGAMHLSLSRRPSETDAISVIHAALAAGTRLIDTADVYCIDDNDIGHNERLIRKAIASSPVDPDEVFVATKGGMSRPDGRWERAGAPDHLLRACSQSATALGHRPIELYYLHVPDPRFGFDSVIETLARLRDEGWIRHIGLSNISLDQLKRALSLTRVEAVQNRCNPLEADDLHNGVIAFCGDNDIAYIPYSPVGGVNGKARLSQNEALSESARRHAVTPADIALAWLLCKGEHIFPIPGATRPATAIAAAATPSITLDPSEIRLIDQLRNR